ncbi:AAA family ATPase [Parageobacillus thermoglucosidasius]|uniref:AAA family ATPase n=1 Tax=Parageobacillus thermoglucosidasius TaxID=1426 RepID=UPI000E16F5B7|nr:AAA family ATPase [Parageobacillus thermoglucosidasius]RDE28986.1 hypothetical protein DV714_07860 [Parageobacillus thermoglucosidasius]
MKKKYYLEVKKLYNKGFYISALSLRGRNKENAEITLAEGLNVISGASDTGKTFIFECINYVFGGSTKPKNIIESNGYTEILIEITTYDERVFTLKRNLTDGKMFKYDCGLKEIYKQAPIEIGNQHNKDDENNYSSFLLSLSGATYKNVVKNKSGHTTSFSFRDFVHISMLHEKKIIESASPIYSEGSRFTKTRSESVFRTIMTGKDDSAFEENKKSDTEKLRAKAKIDVLEDMIVSTRLQIEELTSELKSVNFNIEDFEKSISDLKVQLSEKKQTINLLESKKQQYWDTLQILKSDKMLLNEIKSRFNLLKKNYESDLERLAFIEEAEYYLGQLIDVKCPICNSDFISEVPELNQAVAAEIDKIRFQLYDLNETIKETEQKIVVKENEIQQINNEIKKIDTILEEELKPILGKFNEKIDELILLRDKYKEREFHVEKLTQLQKERDYFKKIVENNNTTLTVNNDINENSIKLFCNIIKKLLEEWKIEEHITVEFDHDKKDIIVNGKAKGSFGKGYAAVLNSAFVIGILQYTIMLGLPHPKVIVLDSPLTTFKGKDKSTSSDEFVINDEVKQAFFKYLSTQKSGMQFIILDNAIPPKEVIPKIKYYYFTKNESLGRYGFIPLQK